MASMIFSSDIFLSRKPNRPYAINKGYSCVCVCVWVTERETKKKKTNHLNNTRERSAPSARERQRHNCHWHHDSVRIAKRQSQGQHRHHFHSLWSDKLGEARGLHYFVLRQRPERSVFRRNPKLKRAKIAKLRGAMPKSSSRHKTRQRNVSEAVSVGKSDETRRNGSSILESCEIIAMQWTIKRDCRAHGEGQWRRKPQRVLC